MSMELADVDQSALQSSGPSVRDALESAVAAHTPSPDVDKAVAGALEQRDTELRRREREKRPGTRDWEAEVSERRREHVRNAVTEARIQASGQASAPKQPETPDAVPVPGAPATWDAGAKAHWDSLPSETRLAIQRDHAGFAKRHGEIEAVLAPARSEYSKHGLSDSQAIGRLMEWESAIRNPATRVQAARALMQQYGMTLQDLGGSPDYQPQQHQASPEQMETANRQVGQFGQDRPHFETVRGTMGQLISVHGEKYVRNGAVDLDRAYRDACKLEGLSTAPSRPANRPNGSRSGIRDQLTAAYRQSRAG